MPSVLREQIYAPRLYVTYADGTNLLKIPTSTNVVVHALLHCAVSSVKSTRSALEVWSKTVATQLAC